MPLQVLQSAALVFFLISCSAQYPAYGEGLPASVGGTSATIFIKEVVTGTAEGPLAVTAIESCFKELIKALTYIDEDLQTQLV